MKILKILTAVAVTLIILNLFQPELQAAGVTTFDEMADKINTFLRIGQASDVGVSENDMGNIMIPIINILTGIGVFVVVIVTIIMGMKYMFATPEEAAKLKQQLIGLVVSAVVVLGATAIWKIIFQILKASGI